MLKNKTNQKGGSIIYNNDLNFNQLCVTVNLRDKLGDPDNFVLLNVLNKLYYTEYENGFEFHPELNYTGFIYLGAYNWVEDEYYTDIALNTYRSRNNKPSFEILRPGMTVLRTTSIDKITPDGLYSDKGYVYGSAIYDNIYKRRGAKYKKIEEKEEYKKLEKKKKNKKVQTEILSDIKTHRYYPHNWLKRNYFSFKKYNTKLSQYKKKNEKILKDLKLNGDNIDFNTLFKYAQKIPAMQPHERIFVSYFGTDYFTFRKFFREKNIEPLFVGITYENQAWNIKSGIFNNYMNTSFKDNTHKPSHLHLSEHDDVLLIYSMINRFRKNKKREDYEFKNKFVEVIFTKFKFKYKEIKELPYLNHEMFIDKCSEFFNKNYGPDDIINRNYQSGIKSSDSESISLLLTEIYNIADQLKITLDQTYVRNEGKSFYNNKILINLLYELTITRNYNNDGCNLNEYYKHFYNTYNLETSKGFTPIGYINDSYSDAISIFENEYCYNQRVNRNLPLTIPFFSPGKDNLPYHRITDNIIIGDSNTFAGGYVYLRKNGYNISHFIRRPNNFIDDHIFYVDYSNNQYIDAAFQGTDKNYDIENISSIDFYIKGTIEKLYDICYELVINYKTNYINTFFTGIEGFNFDNLLYVFTKMDKDTFIRTYSFTKNYLSLILAVYFESFNELNWLVTVNPYLEISNYIFSKLNHILKDKLQEIKLIEADVNIILFIMKNGQSIQLTGDNTYFYKYKDTKFRIREIQVTPSEYVKSFNDGSIIPFTLSLNSIYILLYNMFINKLKDVNLSDLYNFKNNILDNIYLDSNLTLRECFAIVDIEKFVYFFLKEFIQKTELPFEDETKPYKYQFIIIKFFQTIFNINTQNDALKDNVSEQELNQLTTIDYYLYLYCQNILEIIDTSDDVISSLEYLYSNIEDPPIIHSDYTEIGSLDYFKNTLSKIMYIEIEKENLISTFQNEIELMESNKTQLPIEMQFLSDEIKELIINKLYEILSNPDKFFITEDDIGYILDINVLDINVLKEIEITLEELQSLEKINLSLDLVVDIQELITFINNKYVLYNLYKIILNKNDFEVTDAEKIFLQTNNVLNSYTGEILFLTKEVINDNITHFITTKYDLYIEKLNTVIQEFSELRIFNYDALFEGPYNIDNIIENLHTIILTSINTEVNYTDINQNLSNQINLHKPKCISFIQDINGKIMTKDGKKFFNENTNFNNFYFYNYRNFLDNFLINNKHIQTFDTEKGRQEIQIYTEWEKNMFYFDKNTDKEKHNIIKFILNSNDNELQFEKKYLKYKTKYLKLKKMYEYKKKQLQK